MNTVKKVVSFLLRTILRPITDALVIKAIEKGEVSEREIVEKAKRKLIRSIDEELPKCVDYDEEAAKGAAILKKKVMAARTIDDMVKIQSNDNVLKYFNRVFKKAKREYDSDYALKRYIDSYVQRKVEQILKRYADAGVKGMKKGQHVKATDPDYVESLRGSGSSKPRPANSMQKAKPVNRNQAATKPAQKKGGFNGKEFAKGTAFGLTGGLLGGALLSKAFGSDKNGKVSNSQKAGVATGALGGGAAVAGGLLYASKKGWLK